MEKPKRVLVVTFNNSKNNYGGVFQACALYDKLTEMGYDASFLLMKHRANSPSMSPSVTDRIKSVVRGLFALPTRRKRNARAEAFKAFTERTQKRIVYENYQDLLTDPPEADVYLSGSDQVWNPVTIHDELMLSFVPADKRKISYAASMGVEKIPAVNEEKFARYIDRFDAVSVREDTMPGLIARYTEKPIRQHIDPVFFKSKEQWHRMEKEYAGLRYRDYILAYVIEWDKGNNKKIKRLKKETGLPVVAVVIGKYCRISANQAIFDASPEEFLYLLYRARMVVASSFHGVAMSIVFRKPFFAVPGKEKPTRIQSLLRHFSLSDHATLDAPSQEAQYDTDAVDRVTREDIAAAEHYLRVSINGECEDEHIR